VAVFVLSKHPEIRSWLETQRVRDSTKLDPISACCHLFLSFKRDKVVGRKEAIPFCAVNLIDEVEFVDPIA